MCLSKSGKSIVLTNISELQEHMNHAEASDSPPHVLIKFDIYSLEFRPFYNYETLQRFICQLQHGSCYRCRFCCHGSLKTLQWGGQNTLGMFRMWAVFNNTSTFLLVPEEDVCALGCSCRGYRGDAFAVAKVFLSILLVWCILETRWGIIGVCSADSVGRVI